MTLLYCTKTNHITNDLYIFVHFSIFFLPRLCNFWNSTQFSGFCKLLIRTFYSNLMTRHLFWNILISYSNIYEYSERLYFFHIQKTTNFCWLEHIFASFFLRQHEIFLEIECGGSNFVGNCIRSWVTDCNLIVSKLSYILKEKLQHFHKCSFTSGILSICCFWIDGSCHFKSLSSFIDSSIPWTTNSCLCQNF